MKNGENYQSTIIFYWRIIKLFEILLWTPRERYFFFCKISRTNAISSNTCPSIDNKGISYITHTFQPLLLELFEMSEIGNVWTEKGYHRSFFALPLLFIYSFFFWNLKALLFCQLLFSFGFFFLVVFVLIRHLLFDW